VFRLLAFDEPSRDAVEVDDQLPRYAWVLDLLRTAFPSGHSTSSDPISIRRISADDWQEWRRVRHEALSDAPQAFGSSLASWTGEGDTEERWRNRLREVPMNVLASIDGSDVGMCSLTAVENGEAELIAMWVAPGARGRGVGKALVAAVVDEARAAGSARVLLDVVAENESAVALYSACGFVDAGPAGASTRDRRMRLVLA
jgi:ribosomal protein S18 acetylase RimI-like enzyme